MNFAASVLYLVLSFALVVFVGLYTKTTSELARYKAYHGCVQAAMQTRRWIGISSCEFYAEHLNIAPPSHDGPR